MVLASLVQPAFGLVFWMTLSFLTVLFILAKFAWKPILKSLHEREQGIEDALNESKRMREEMARMAANNEELMRQAREEREVLLKEARDIRDREIAEAKAKAKAEAALKKMMDEEAKKKGLDKPAEGGNPHKK